MKVVEAPPGLDLTAPGTARPVVRRRRPLPGGRAVFGGFLVAVAVVGTVAAQQAASGPPSSRYVVAAGTLSAGRTIGPADLTTRAVELPEPLARRAYRDTRPLLGRVLAATVAEGELVQASALAARGPVAGEREVSFTADPARSLGQRIGPGDVVDVYATSQGERGGTELVVRSARVIDRQGRQGAAGFIYTVALADPSAVEALVQAAAAGSITIVRATAAPGPAGPPGGG